MVDTPHGRRPRRRQRADGYEAEGDPGLDDEDDEDLNEAVVGAVPAREPLSETENHDSVQDFTPRNRLAQVAQRSKKFEQEYRLKLIHRMLMRGIPLDQIASELDVSVRTIQRDRQELYSRLREAAKKFDLNHYIGDHLGFYQEASAMAMRAASNSKTPINHRLAALRTAGSLRQQGTRMLDSVGVFDVVRFKPESSRGNDDIRRLTNIARSLLGVPTGEEKQEEQSVARQIPESMLFDESVLDDDEEEIYIL